MEKKNKKHCHPLFVVDDKMFPTKSPTEFKNTFVMDKMWNENNFLINFCSCFRNFEFENDKVPHKNGIGFVPVS